jgi:hypothetical protein
MYVLILTTTGFILTWNVRESGFHFPETWNVRETEQNVREGGKIPGMSGKNFKVVRECQGKSLISSGMSGKISDTCQGKLQKMSGKMPKMSGNVRSGLEYEPCTNTSLLQ